MAIEMAGRPIEAVLFDVDGTLVDSTYLHVFAWLRAFSDLGLEVPSWSIHRDIGMDSGRLLADLLGANAERWADEMKEAHGRRYAELKGLLRPLDGARELLRRLADRSVLLVLATSAPPEELVELRRVLDCDDLIAAQTNAEDVDEAKPEPDIVQVGLDRIGVGAEQAAFVGDAVWDMQAARRVGLACVGVLTGGITSEELTEAGADRVYESVAVIAAEFAEIGR